MEGRVGCWSREPITSMGGLRMVPDMILDDLDPADSNLLILPAADMWDAGGGTAFAGAARVTWTPGFPWRPFAVPRLASSELVSWTTAATPALQRVPHGHRICRR
ncbi:MAG TPA: hypothetical protein VJ820_14510 [Propionibacteriaceae bacterium]|nr:hypothetical protein [Propionibacteriaceae bacterium]